MDGRRHGEPSGRFVRERRRAPRRVHLTPALRESLHRNAGANARLWIAGLEGAVIVAELEWSITVGPMMGGGTASVCFDCRSAADAPLVLKLSPLPGTSEREVDALRLWEAAGGARVIASAPDAGAILLERVEPSERAWNVDDLEALLGRIQIPAAGLGTVFPRLDAEVDFRLERARRLFHRQVQTASAELNLRAARRVASRLLATHDRSGDRLLHGDLLDRNILCRGGDPVAIDPRPCVGDPAYDVAMWALAHDPRQGVKERLVGLAAGLGIEPERAISWAWFLAALRMVTTAAEDRVIYRDLLRDDAFQMVATR